MSSERKASDILRLDNELLQRFVRIDLDDEDDLDDYHKSRRSKRQSIVNSLYYNEQLKKRSKPTESKKKKDPRELFYEVYTDKDRAAAVSAGSFDIKESLVQKRKQDRNQRIHLNEETDINALITLGLKDMKNGNLEHALKNISRAIELSGNDINALIARSRCYLYLGESAKALQDAETALNLERNNIRALYQKAESLYFLGQFEQSLMFFHQGLQLRPELPSFRLGIQKTQEAIENTVGVSTKKNSKSKNKKSVSSSRTQTSSELSKPSYISKPHTRLKTSKMDREKRNARQLLGELCVDKEYMENLLKNPNLKRADTNTENISIYAREAVDFLNKRQEFWRQRRPCTALPNQKHLPDDEVLEWF